MVYPFKEPFTNNLSIKRYFNSSFQFSLVQLLIISERVSAPPAPPTFGEGIGGSSVQVELDVVEVGDEGADLRLHVVPEGDMVTRVPSPLPMWYLTPVHEPSSSSLCLHSSPHLGKDRGARVALLALSQSEMARGNSTQALYLARVMQGRTRRVQAAMAAVDGRRRGTL